MSAAPLLRRRSALALAALGATAVAGCDDGGSEPAAGPSPTVDPDTALVDEVVTELIRAERVATAGGRLELASLHRAHLEALDGRVPAGSPARPVSAAVVRRREQHLQAHLVDAAMAAESGALARLLASMSAAVAQRLAVDGATP